MAKKPEKPEKSEKPEKTEPPEKPEPADLLALVAALHRQHRRLRWTVVALTLVTLTALAGAGAALLAPYNAELGLYLRRRLGRPETIAVEKTILEAEKFALRTPDGKVRAALAARDDATPSLALYDDDGTARADLALSAEGLHALQLEDKGQPRAVLGAGSEGKRKASTPSSLLLFDKDGSVIFQA